MLAEALRSSLLLNCVTGQVVPGKTVFVKPRKIVETHDQFTLDIPEHWEVVKLADLGKIVGGGTPKSKEPSYWGGEVVWVTPADMRAGGKKITSGGRNISDEGLNNSSARLLPEGSLVVSSRAPIGYVKIAACQMSTSQGCKSVVFNSEVCVDYFYYVLVAFAERLNCLGSGTTFKEISGRTLGGLEVPLPPLEEQREIAKHLDALMPLVDELAVLEREREKI